MVFILLSISSNRGSFSFEILATFYVQELVGLSVEEGSIKSEELVPV
jgi:hypothetical protein